MLRNVQTVRDAKAAILQLCRTQLQRAEAANAAMNEPIEGDSRAKVHFQTVLPPVVQREVFLELVHNSRFWPRLFCLCGAPPYDFLIDGDNFLLRAAGIAKRRANMALLYRGGSSYGNFGPGQFVDAASRRYKLLAEMRSDADKSTLLWRNPTPGALFLVDVKMKVMRNETKRAILARPLSAAHESLHFPRQGDVLKLALVPHLVQMATATEEVVHARVKGARPTHLHARIARMLVEIL